MINPLDILAPIGLAAGAGAFGATAIALRNHSDGPTITQQGLDPASRVETRESEGEGAERRAADEGEGEATA